MAGDAIGSVAPRLTPTARERTDKGNAQLTDHRAACEGETKPSKPPGDLQQVQWYRSRKSPSCRKSVVTVAPCNHPVALLYPLFSSSPRQ